jgi:protease-4
LLRRSTDDYASLVALLRWACDDDRLQGVLIRCEHVQASWARIQGLRRHLERLRRAGKRVWVHLDAAGIHEYYLASAADRITLTPAATLSITGLASEAVFVLGALEKVGVHADVVQMGRYKSAAEMFTRRDMSPAHREMMAIAAPSSRAKPIPPGWSTSSSTKTKRKHSSSQRVGTRQ